MTPGGSVLILEDDPDVRGLLGYVFAQAGHSVSECASPAQVIAMASRTPGALAVVDFWGRSHQTLAADERDELSRLAHAVPTIMITGRVWADSETREGLGLIALVKKPFDVFDLTALVSDVLTQLGADRAAVAR